MTHSGGPFISIPVPAVVDDFTTPFGLSGVTAVSDLAKIGADLVAVGVGISHLLQ